MKIKKIANVLIVVWFLSVVGFIGIILAGYDSVNPLQQNSTVLVIVALTGSIAFLGVLVLRIVHFLFLRKKVALGTSGSVRKAVSPLVYVFVGVVLALFGIGTVKGAYNLGKAEESSEIVNTTPTTPMYQSPMPIQSQPAKNVDPDPIVNCGPGEKSGQYVKDKNSNCKNYTDCGFRDGTWRMMLKNECTQAQSQENASINQKNLVSCYAYGQTFKLTLEECQYFQKADAALPPVESIINNATTPVQTNTNNGNSNTDYSALNQQNIELRSQCQGSVASYYQQQQASINSRKDIGDSSKQNLLEENKKQWEQASKACEVKYPAY